MITYVKLNIQPDSETNRAKTMVDNAVHVLSVYVHLRLLLESDQH